MKQAGLSNHMYPGVIYPCMVTALAGNIKRRWPVCICDYFSNCIRFQSVETALALAIYTGGGEFAKFGKANLNSASSLRILNDEEGGHPYPRPTLCLFLYLAVILILDLTLSEIVELIGGFKGATC